MLTPSRLLEILSAIACLLVLAVAASIEPRPAGFGSHEDLGLEPCPYLRSTGRPCPTCGMTTAFAAGVRLRLVDSFRANPAGLLLCLVAMAIPPWVLLSMRRGLPAVRVLSKWTPLTLLAALFLVVFLAWAYKLASWPSA